MDTGWSQKPKGSIECPNGQVGAAAAINVGGFEVFRSRGALT